MAPSCRRCLQHEPPGSSVRQSRSLSAMRAAHRPAHARANGSHLSIALSRHPLRFSKEARYRRRRFAIHPRTKRGHARPASPCRAQTILLNPRKSSTAVPERRHCLCLCHRAEEDRKGRRCTCRQETIAEHEHVRSGSTEWSRLSSASISIDRCQSDYAANPETPWRSRPPSRQAIASPL